MKKLIERFFKELHNCLCKANKNGISLNEHLDHLSLAIDEEVIIYVKENNVKPLGGQIFINNDKEMQKITVRWDFYFIDNNNKNIKISSRDTVEYDFFDEESRKRIGESLIFNINPPAI